MADKPTICIDASRIPHDVATGTENVSSSVIRAMLELPEAAEYRFLLYAPQRLPDAFQPNTMAEVHTRIVGTGRPWLLRFARALRGDRRVIQALYVPSHMVPPFGLPTRTVTMIHGMEWARAPWAYEWFERRKQAYATRHALHNCQTIITPSQATKHQLIRWAKQNDYIVPFIEVAPHGVPPLPAAPASMPAEFSTEIQTLFSVQKTPFIVAIGRTDTRKQLNILVSAFTAFCQQNNASNAQLLIAGPQGSGHQALQAAIQASDARERIHAVGSVSNQAKSWLIQNAAALAYVSAAEGFGLPVLEAAQLGCPMILSDDQAISETVQTVEKSEYRSVRGLSSYVVRTPEQQEASLSLLTQAIEWAVFHSLAKQQKTIDTARVEPQSEIFSWAHQAKTIFHALTS